MKERLICAALTIPAFIYCGVDFSEKYKKFETPYRVLCDILLLGLAMYLGIVLPQ